MFRGKFCWLYGTVPSPIHEPLDSWCGGVKMSVLGPGKMGVLVKLKASARNCSVNCSLDRKSTRLNSSHRCISYAVFCLKKKKNEIGLFDEKGVHSLPSALDL